MSKKIVLLVISCLLLLQVGCGGGPSGATGKDDPWDLFTQKEAEAVLGFKVEPELQKIEAAGQKIVYYGAVSKDKTDFIQVSVVRNEEMGDSLKEQGYTAKQLFEETKKNFSDSSQAVKGFGDEAFWTNGGLHILSDTVYITISTGDSDTPETLERAKEVAKKVMSKR